MQVALNEYGSRAKNRIKKKIRKFFSKLKLSKTWNKISVQHLIHISMKMKRSAQCRIWTISLQFILNQCINIVSRASNILRQSHEKVMTDVFIYHFSRQAFLCKSFFDIFWHTCRLGISPKGKGNFQNENFGLSVCLFH